MVVYGLTAFDMCRALDTINSVWYDGNIVFKRLERISRNAIRFTLKVKDSRAKGSRVSHSGRRVASACWHVHGNLFDVLLNIRQEVRIRSGKILMYNNSTGGHEGNWQDRNIGSQAIPLMYSKACDCKTL